MFEKLTEKIIWICFLALAIVTPLIFSTQNTEIFEVPKMHFVYIIATILFFSTLIKQTLDGKFSIPKSIPILAFLIFITFQTISTLTSIDKFTSVFGYPSRLNGGLLSQFTYFAIFISAIINLDAEKSKKILMAIVTASVAVSLWGIPSHFGKDPNCLVLVGKLTSSCWQKEFDPTLRIFSTLGQPNWLASYLVLTIPLSIAFFITATHSKLKVLFGIFSFLMFFALVLTNSRAGILGFAVSIGIMSLLFGIKIIKKNIKSLAILGLIFVLVAIVFGNFLFLRINEAVNKTQNAKDLTQQSQSSTTAVPRGTESGQIRLIVWKGAIDAFVKKPFFGWGPETFAYSYYQNRPLEHNNTTEWNFFYNKAHNEFINYLTNTGLFGLLSFTAFILLTMYSIYKFLIKAQTKEKIIASAVIGAFIGYLTTIFFGFSTVATQTTAYLALAAALTLGKTQNFKDIKIKQSLAFPLILFLLIGFFYTLSLPARSYLADVLENNAQNKSAVAAISAGEAAVTVFPGQNPFYLSQLAMDLASYNSDFQDEEFTKKTIEITKEVDLLSPNNLILQRRLANVFILLSQYNESTNNQALETGNKIVKLAPTDPQSYLSLAKIQISLGQNEQAKQSVQKALELKKEFVDAQKLMDELTIGN